jgi:ATP-dependent DNA helicase RecG
MELSTPVTELPQISSKYAKTLEKLGVSTVKDLLTHFPTYHKDTTQISTIESMKDGGKYVVRAFPKSVKSIRLRGNRTLQTAILSDESGSIKVNWFNQPYLEKALTPDSEYLFAGNAKISRNHLEFYPNAFEQVIEGKESVHIGRIAPQYALTAGVSIKWLRNRIKYLIDRLEEIEDLKDELAKTKYSKPELNTSSVVNYSLRRGLHDMHFPETNEEMKPAREKLSLMELCQLQLMMIAKRASSKKFRAPEIALNTKVVNKFISELVFKLTPDQL